MAQAPTLPLRDAVAVITGAAGGIGASLALALAARGTHLALADVNAAELARTAMDARARGVRVTEHVLDVADRAAVAALPAAVLPAHGRVSILVNNAGVALGGTFAEVSADDFDWLMAINFGGTVAMTRAFLPLLKREPAAQLVNLSSLFGLIAPPGQCAYAASKFAVRGFSESLRHELEAEASPVGVTVVHPGGVRTGIARHARMGAHVSGAQDLRASAEAAWEVLLKMDPAEAAARIVQGLERREKRVLVGRDAVQGAWLQRLVPVNYWQHVARDMARRLKRAGVGLQETSA